MNNNLIKILSYKAPMNVDHTGGIDIAYLRVIVFDNGKIAPVTIAVIGSNRRMCGIKFSVFNADESIENGVFLPVSQSEWDTRVMEKQKIKASV